MATPWRSSAYVPSHTPKLGKQSQEKKAFLRWCSCFYYTGLQFASSDYLGAVTPTGCHTGCPERECLLSEGSGEGDISWEMGILQPAVPRKHTETHWKMLSCSWKRTSWSILMPHAAWTASHETLGANKMALLHCLLPKSHTQFHFWGEKNCKCSSLNRLLSTSIRDDVESMLRHLWCD